MARRVVPIVSYAVQSKGPVLSGLMPDSGAALGAAYLLRDGSLPMVFDYNNVGTIGKISKIGKEAFIEEAIDEQARFDEENGIRVRFTKLYANGFADNVRIHRELKRRNPGLTIVGVGPHVDWFGEKILDYAGDSFDVLCYGDGGPNASRLIRAAYGEEDIGNIPGIIYKNDGRQLRTEGDNADLKGLPFPLYEEEFYPSIRDKIMIPAREDGRGCIWSRCTYCAHPIISGKRYRSRPISDLADEINSSPWTATRLSSPDTPPKYINRILPLIPGKRVSAFGYSMPGYDFRGLEGKMIGVFMGLESTDPHILRDVLNKTKDPESYLRSAEENIRGFRESGVSTIVAMMTCPGESRETLDRDLEFIRRVNPDFVVTLPMTPLPGTESYKMANNNPRGSGLMLDEDFDEKFMLFEIDLLKDPGEQESLPFKSRYNGEFVDPFLPATEFTRDSVGMGFYPLSDEIVLMADRYHGGLSHDQEERRAQCAGFMKGARDDIQSGNIRGLRERVDEINRNQVL